MKNCKVCGDKTEVVFNIDFKATPICENCATAIFLQQAKWYAETKELPINNVMDDLSQNHKCKYSKSMNQSYPRLCIDCGKPEVN
jgi:beta-glucanase (GH16 family)